MTTIKWQGTTNSLDSAASAAGVSLYVDGGRASTTAPAQSGLRDSLSPSTQTRLLTGLENALSGALSRLSERIDAVSWPSSGSFATGLEGTISGARLVSVPQELAAELSASFNAPGVSSLEDRLATSRRRADSASGLAAGTYSLKLSLGDATDTLDVSVGQGWTTGQVLDAVAAAANASSLAVDAQVRTDSAGFNNGLSALVLSADASHAGEAVALANASGAGGGLGSWLGLSAANVAQARDLPAETGVINVTGLSAAKPTRYASQGFDPEAPTTLAPGSYTLSYLVGPAQVGTTPEPGSESGSVSIQVVSGDTWGDVLSRMAHVLGSASPALTAQLVPAKRVWTLPDSAGGGTGTTDAQGLEVTAETGKTGWRLRLSGADAASENMLAAMGLDATAQPGVTGRAVIDGEARQSASGQYSAGGGLLTVGVDGTFGEAAPLRVSEAATTLADALADVLAAYNDVGSQLAKNNDSLAPGVAEKWSGLAAGRASALDSIGVARAGQSLWLDEERFLLALFSRPDEAYGTLLGDGGFLPSVQASAQAALESGLDDWMRASHKATAALTPGELAVRNLEKRTEAQVERANQLLDLYDSGKGASGLGSSLPGLDFMPGAGILSRKG